MLIPVAGLTLGLAGTAGAAGKIQCTMLSGNASGTITLGGGKGAVCLGTDGSITALKPLSAK
jgi:hypothetical protein